MSLLVKDKSNEIENLFLYNFNTKTWNVNPTHLMPIGAKFIIKVNSLLKLFPRVSPISYLHIPPFIIHNLII